MFKRSLVLSVLLLLLALSQPSQAGWLWTTKEKPGGLGLQQTEVTKSGEAACSKLFNLIEFGSCGLNSARENGGLSKIYYYDISTFNVIMGWLYKKETTTVYGE